MSLKSLKESRLLTKQFFDALSEDFEVIAEQEVPKQLETIKSIKI